MNLLPIDKIVNHSVNEKKQKNWFGKWKSSSPYNHTLQTGLSTNI